MYSFKTKLAICGLNKVFFIYSAGFFLGLWIIWACRLDCHLYQLALHNWHQQNRPHWVWQQAMSHATSKTNGRERSYPQTGLFKVCFVIRQLVRSMWQIIIIESLPSMLSTFWKSHFRPSTKRPQKECHLSSTALVQLRKQLQRGYSKSMSFSPGYSILLVFWIPNKVIKILPSSPRPARGRGGGGGGGGFCPFVVCSSRGVSPVGAGGGGRRVVV